PTLLGPRTPARLKIAVILSRQNQGDIGTLPALEQHFLLRRKLHVLIRIRIGRMETQEAGSSGQRRHDHEKGRELKSQSTRTAGIDRRGGGLVVHYHVL